MAFSSSITMLLSIACLLCAVAFSAPISVRAAYGPTFDSTRVPSLSHDYTSSLPSTLPPVSSWSDFTPPTSVTSNRIWTVTNNQLSSIVIGDYLSNSVNTEPRLLANSTWINPRVCQQPLLSTTRDLKNYGYTYMYILCQPNVIITVSVNDVTGSYIMDSRPRINVPAYPSTFPNNFNSTKSTISVVGQMTLRTYASSDLLILNIEGGSIFVIDPSTGLHARKPLTRTTSGMGSYTFTSLKFVTTDPTLYNVDCLGAAIGSTSITFFVARMPTSSYSDWSVSYTSTIYSSATVKLIDSTNAVYFQLSSTNYFNIKRFDKSYHTIKTVNIYQYNVPSLAQAFEYSNFYNSRTLFVGTNSNIYMCDWSSQTLTSLYSVGPVLVDTTKDQIYLFSTSPGKLTVATFSSLFWQSSSSTGIKALYSFGYASVSSDYYNPYQKLFTVGSAYYQNPIIPSFGPYLQNSFLVYSYLAPSSSTTKRLTVQVIKTQYAASCSTFTLPTWQSSQCGCQGLTGTKTARNCAWTGYSCGESTSPPPSYCYSYTGTSSSSTGAYYPPYAPSTPYYHSSSSSFNWRILVAVLVSLFVLVGLIIIICIVRHRAEQKRRSDAAAANARVINGAPGGIAVNVAAAVPFLAAPSTPQPNAVVPVQAHVVATFSSGPGMVHSSAGASQYQPLPQNIPMAMIVPAQPYSQPYFNPAPYAVNSGQVYHQLREQPEGQAVYPSVQ